MNRRDFMARCAALSSTVPFFAFLTGCAKQGGLYDGFEVNFSGKVLVIGAGAAGLAAGYMLDRYGIDFEILEASDRIGGRVRRGDGFADFPIDLGAEWIHDSPSILSELIDDDSVQGSIDVVPYSPDTIAVYSEGSLTALNVGTSYYSEHKFKRTTWYDFLETYIAANILDRVRLRTPVADIDYSGEGVIVTAEDGTQHEADAVIIAVPLKILQEGLIHFAPALPDTKRSAIDAVSIPPGLKIFFEFSERFYPDLTSIGSSFDHLFYDAAFRKDSDRNILAMFYVADSASAYTDLGSDEKIAAKAIAKLDEIFNGKASETLINTVVQSWSGEPYIQGAYSFDWAGSYDTILERLAEAIDGKLYWAGEHTSAENVATVHGAMQSGYAAVEALLRG